ncbi:MAG TPA: hypothetical protein VJN93_16100 [Candidatus Acidoferrum sp.]|nr:hypothetical protein [Candidatus Acidoferrum sp.]
MKIALPLRSSSSLLLAACLGLLGSTEAPRAGAQENEYSKEIVANLAGGRVIVHVAKDRIVFAAIDHPIETNSVPPRVVGVDSEHIGVLLGASEWRSTADPQPVRLDRDMQRITAPNPHYETNPDEIAPDLDTIGVAFLERLRPLVSQLQHKIDFNTDEPIFEIVLIGYGPEDYGPEVWKIDYRIQQEEIATRGDFWQTRILRPRYTQLYPPEKHSPKTLVEVRYPANLPGPTLQQLIEGNYPDIDTIAHNDPKFLKVEEDIEKGQANKASPLEATDFMKAILPTIAGKSRYILGTMTEDGGFNWVVAPEEPVEKVKAEKKRPQGAPSLRRQPNPG